MRFTNEEALVATGAFLVVSRPRATQTSPNAARMACIVFDNTTTGGWRVTNKSILFACLLVAALCGPSIAAKAQAPNADQPKRTFASEYDHMLTDVEKLIVEAAEAMPEDKFNFAPTAPGDFKGVRTFALELKHIAVANYMLGSGILQEKPPVEMKGPNGPDNITSRADVLKFLKDSFAYAHKAMASISESNVLESIKLPYGNAQTTRLTLATRILGHPYDHYGQMVVYLRMNGIIPPASRRQ